MWKTLSSKIIFEHPFITLIEDEVLLPSGVKTTWLKFTERTGCSATIICQRKDGKILVQEEYIYPVNQKILQFPGGYIDPKEKPEIGAKEELKEETGFTVGKMKPLGKYLFNDRRSKAMVHVFLATDLKKGVSKRDSEEEDNKIFWFSVGEIDKLISKGKINQCNFLSCWALFKNFKLKI
ncbi:NUDIX hydrolase [Patescibacteria group bacterium]